MKSRNIGAAVLAAALLVGVVWLAHQSRKVLPLEEATSTLEPSRVSDECTQPEAIDRWLLQQTWFHDPGFTRLAGAFGRASFSLYEDDEASTGVEGAFCISGTDLMVRYHERSFVPVSFSASDWSVSFDTKLTPLGADVYSVRELTKDKMTLAFASDGREHVFYRKH